MNTYLVDGQQYSFNYQKTKEQYENIVNLSNKEFLKDLTSHTHFACFVAYFKGIGVEAVLSDLGLIHQMIHLKLTEESGFMVEEKETLLKEVRNQFRYLLKLS